MTDTRTGPGALGVLPNPGDRPGGLIDTNHKAGPPTAQAVSELAAETQPETAGPAPPMTGTARAIPRAIRGSVFASAGGERLAKLIRMLASDKAGEAAAAAAALGRQLQASGRDFHDLAAVAEREFDLPEIRQPPRRAAQPAPPRTSIIGLHIELDRSSDREKPCCDRYGIIREGRGPHRYSLRCACCGKHRGWVKGTAADLLQAMHLDGRLSATPTLRDVGVVP